EDEIDARASPLEFTRCAIAPFEHVLGVGYDLPLRTHVEQVHGEVVGQRFRPLGKNAVFRLSGVVFRARMPPTSTVISGAASVINCARSTSKSSADTGYLPL